MESVSNVSVGGRMRLTAVICMMGIAPFYGCGGPALVRYDDRTYQQITFVKPEILAAYDSFKSDPVNDAKVDDLNLKLAQLHEYEAGKGPGNVDMTQQVESVQKLFKKHVAERKRDGPWNDAALNMHKDSITEALDLAIKTERAKNK